MTAAQLVPYVLILRETFPEGVGPSMRPALMAAIYDEFSERNLGEVLEAFLGEDRHQLLGEAIRARSQAIEAGDIEGVRRLLERHGWEFDS